MADNRPAPVARPAPVVRPGEGPRAATRRVAAEAKKAEAEARGLEAQAKLKQIEAQTKAAERAAERAARQSSGSERVYQMGVNLAAVMGGVAFGYKVAGGIEKRHAAALDAAGKQVRALGATANKLLSPKSKMPRALMLAKLKGVVSTADKLGLSKVKGPLGIAPAAFMIADGLGLRFGMTRAVENEAARELVGAVGQGLALAGGTLIYKRAMYNATLSKLPEARAFAAIQAARARLGVTVPGQVAAKTHAPVVQAGAKAIAATTAAGNASTAAGALRVASKTLAVAGKVALPLQIAATTLAAIQGYRQDGARGALIGAGDSLTFGLASRVVAAARARMADSESGRLALAQHAANRAQGRSNWEARTAKLRGAARPKAGNGWTAAYHRVQAGRTVRVAGYRTPTRRGR